MKRDISPLLCLLRIISFSYVLPLRLYPNGTSWWGNATDLILILASVEWNERDGRWHCLFPPTHHHLTPSCIFSHVRFLYFRHLYDRNHYLFVLPLHRATLRKVFEGYFIIHLSLSGWSSNFITVLFHFERRSNFYFSWHIYCPHIPQPLLICFLISYVFYLLYCLIISALCYLVT
jgi:hypothetical protein